MFRWRISILAKVHFQKCYFQTYFPLSVVRVHFSFFPSSVLRLKETFQDQFDSDWKKGRFNDNHKLKIYAFKISFNPLLSLSLFLRLWHYIFLYLHHFTAHALSHGPLSRNYEIFSSSFPWVYDWSLVVARVNVELLLSEGG